MLCARQPPGHLQLYASWEMYLFSSSESLLSTIEGDRIAAAWLMKRKIVQRFWNSLLKFRVCPKLKKETQRKMRTTGSIKLGHLLKAN